MTDLKKFFVRFMTMKALSQDTIREEFPVFVDLHVFVNISYFCCPFKAFSTLLDTLHLDVL